MEEYDDKFFEEYMSTSLDDMEFDDAVTKDKRTYCEHMVENLIEDQIILSTFSYFYFECYFIFCCEWIIF